eukprot:492044_1
MAIYSLWNFIILIYIATATDLIMNYTQNATLTLTNSPYYVSSNVLISTNTTISIENGVEIIFTDDYTINLHGNIKACSGNNLNSANVGLIDTNTYIYIHANDSQIRIGKISITSSGFAIFCNTKFENMYYSLSNQYTISNSEFTNMEYATYDTSATIISSISNSIFTTVTNINYGIGIIYDNCIFQSFDEFFSHTQPTDIAVRNSKIHGNGIVNYCIKLTTYTGDPSTAIYNNSIDNCGYGIYIIYSNGGRAANGLIIQHNTISNCTSYGMSVQNYGTDIRYNTFIDNQNYGLTTRGRTASYVRYNDFINNGNGDVIDIAVEIKYCDNITVAYNTFINGNGRAIYGECDYLYIEYNNFSYNTNRNGWGLITTSTSNADYYYINYNNFISNSVQLLIDGRNGYWYEINNNYFFNNTVIDDQSGSYPHSSLIKQSTSYSPYVNAFVINNTIINNIVIAPYYAAIYYFDCGQNGGSCASLIFKHNIIRDNIVSQATSTSRFAQNSVITLAALASATIQYNDLMNNIAENNFTSSSVGNSVLLFVDNNQVDSKILTDIQFNNFHESNLIDSYIYFYFYLEPGTIIENNNFYSFENIR